MCSDFGSEMNIKRYRSISGRILVELLYGSTVRMIKGDTAVSEGIPILEIDLTALARRIHVRPARIVETLEWMDKVRMIDSLEHRYRKCLVVLRPSNCIIGKNGKNNG